jgi:hypothetical protein
VDIIGDLIALLNGQYPEFTFLAVLPFFVVAVAFGAHYLRAWRAQRGRRSSPAVHAPRRKLRFR